MKLNIQYFGGRGASAELADGPIPGGNGNNVKYGQPHTPVMRPPAPTIEAQIGEKLKPQSPKKAMERVNIDRNAIDSMNYADYTANCQRCVIAYELNRRGYNVEAESTYQNDTYPVNGMWMKAFKNAQSEYIGDYSTTAVSSNLKNKMKKWGNGSRGILRVSGNKGGHVFNVEYRMGRLEYYDAQTNTRYSPKNVFNHVNLTEVEVIRTDNLQITDHVKNLVRKSRRPR